MINGQFSVVEDDRHRPPTRAQARAHCPPSTMTICTFVEPGTILWRVAKERWDRLDHEALIRGTAARSQPSVH